MQTKKRAKPVKFGKHLKKETEVSEKITKEEAEADINSDEAKEIKQLIEEKTHPKDEEEFDEEHKQEIRTEEESREDDEEREDMVEEEKEFVEDEPEEIKLSKEPDEKEEDTDEDDEEQMALEATEPTLEVEPDELHEKTEKTEKDDAQSAFGSFTSDEVNKKQKKGYFGFFLLVATITFVVGLLVIGGFSYFFSADSEKLTGLPSFTSATPTPTQSLEPSATPTPEEVDLSAYAVRVLNGSGITGEAAAVRTLLEEKGFEVAGIGNAATSDYTKTVISAKEDVEEAYLTELIKALQEQYSVNSVVEDASSSQTADVVVTVGSDSAE